MVSYVEIFAGAAVIKEIQNYNSIQLNKIKSSRYLL